MTSLALADTSQPKAHGDLLPAPRTPARTSPRGWDLAAARDALRTADPVMAGLIDARPELDPDAWRATVPVEGLFEALLYQVVGQQISVTAMTAIYGRLRALFPYGRPDPALLAQTPVETLRATGLSGRKAEYVRDLGARAATGGLDGLEALSHEEARNRLVTLRGIGPWTADGALLIAFGWPDVFVSGDLVMRKGVQRAYDLPALPSVQEVEAIGERWRPFRTLAAGYLFDLMVPDLDLGLGPNRPLAGARPLRDPPRSVEERLP